MKKRVVARIQHDGSQYYEIQNRKFGVWFTLTENRVTVTVDTKYQAMAALSDY